MCKAEDDEIVLDEVVIEPIDVKHEVLSRSDSLKIPGTTGQPPGARPHTLGSVLMQISPKIAPKFTREKLKSMLRKGKKFAMDHPLFKMKGVTFSRDTKYDDDNDDDDDETDHPTSLLDVHEPQEVKITLSTPELTETEKLMGVHPYQFIQQRTPTPSGFANALPFQTSDLTLPYKECFSSNETEIPIQPEEHGLVRSQSLPNISQRTTERVKLEDYITTQLKKKVQMPGKGTKKEKKRQKRRKSPPPPPPGGLDIDLPSDTQSDQEFSDVSTSSPRRNTLPQIMVTRCDQKSPNHLDLAITPPSSIPSSGHSSDSGTSLARHHRRVSADSPSFLARDRSRSRSPQSRESLPSSECSSVSSKGTKTRTTTGDSPPLFPKPKMLPQSKAKELSPSQTPKGPKTLRPPTKPHIQIPKAPDFPFSKEQPATAPAKPSTLRGSQIFAKSRQQKSESLPGSPTSDIPCVSGTPDSPSFPHSSQRTRESPRGSPTPSSSQAMGTPDITQRLTPQDTQSKFELTSVVVTDPRESSTVTEDNLRPAPLNPPIPPPRPAPRRGSRGRK